LIGLLSLGLAFSCLNLSGQGIPDWLVHPISKKAEVRLQERVLILDNGLLRRSFYLGENLACFDFTNNSNGQQLLRALKPEARLVLDGVEYQVGGLSGQKEQAYLLPEWLPGLRAEAEAFFFSHHEVLPLRPRLEWKPGTWTGRFMSSEGKELILYFYAKEPNLKGFQVKVHYALYEGIPLVAKWLTLRNGAAHTVRIDRVVNEILALVEEESAVVGSTSQMQKQHGIHFETDYAFNNAMRYDLSDQTTHWKADSSYSSQVNYHYQTPCVVEVYPEYGPGIDLAPGDSLISVRTHELLMDSYDRQRRGLMIRRMYRTIAPWTTQNPIFMHLISKHDEEVIRAIDQCVQTGYEAIILSFGSHLNMEDTSAANIARWKNLADMAHARGILLGGYALFSSRRISDADDVIHPVTGKPGGAFFGHAPCFGSAWGLGFRERIMYFFEKTGFDIWENDGPYPGDLCASTSHPGHRDLADSQWRQMEIQKGLYRWMNSRGIYINAPDWYFLDGTHKIGLGYREVNFSLPREQQRILNRQNIHDGTLEKLPSMGWGFVPLTRYQGGGPEAVLEPLEDHLEDYEQLMVQYYGAGVQACYRGPRLYDTEKTRLRVAGVIAWYKQYRDILNADIMHLRRPDGRDWDGLLHVDPGAARKGLLMLYNPLKEAIRRTISVPLYYTGLTERALFREKEGPSVSLALDRQYAVSLEVVIPAASYTWFTIE